jgi:hypothetical protein
MESSITDLDRHRYISLVTFRHDGSEAPTPVWFAERYAKLYVYTDGTSYKVRRIRATDRIRVAPCNVVGKVTGTWINGRARLISDPTLVRHAYDALQRKYGVQLGIATLASWLSGRIKRRAVLELDLDLGQLPGRANLT